MYFPKEPEPKRLPRTIPFAVIEVFMATIYQELQLTKTDFQRNTVLRDIAAIELLFATGARISELCSLKIKDVDLKAQRILIWGKGAKERILQIVLFLRTLRGAFFILCHYVFFTYKIRNSCSTYFNRPLETNIYIFS